MAPTSPDVRLGLAANWRQFALLVLVNAFVGAMVGLERTVLPLLAEAEFGLASKSVALSFLVAFGLVKAVTNLAAGALADRLGRKRLLIAGWLAGLPVPLLLIWAPAWGWVVAANLLLGVNQGLCWSLTVIMKVDLAGPRRRGLAMGLNEFAGYAAVSLAALVTGYLAAAHGLRPVPFYPGIAFAVLGLGLSLFAVRDTADHVSHEARLTGEQAVPSFARVLLLASWRDRTLFAASQAGMTNNLNDAMMWGLLPILLTTRGFPLPDVAAATAAYPAAWGIAQLATGALSDRWGRKWMVAAGMWVQAAAIALFAIETGFAGVLAAALLLGLGTALVYPTLLAAVADVAQPSWRASAVGVYRLWRDGGYAVGAVAAGLLADAFGIPAAVAAVAGLTALSGAIVATTMPETPPRRAP
jgi:MFS family permease